MTVRLRAPDNSEPGAVIFSEGIIGEQVRCAVVSVPNSQVEEVAPVDGDVGSLPNDGIEGEAVSQWYVLVEPICCIEGIRVL